MRQWIGCGWIVCLLMVGIAHAALTPLDMVSADALAFARIGDLPKLLDEIDRILEQEGLDDLPEIQEGKQQFQQILPIVPMLTGVEFEDFIRMFGHEIAVAFYGLDGNRPILAFLIDVRQDPELAAETIDEIRILAESNAEELPQPGNYRGIDYEEVVNPDMTLRFAFLENLFTLGLNGGFERVVDRKLGDGTSLRTTAIYQKMTEQLEPTGEVWGYADLAKIVPLVAETGAMEDPGAAAILSSLEHVGFKVDLTGYQQQLYLGAHAPDHPLFKIFYDLIFTQRPPMLSSSWLAETQGVWLGLNLGDPATLFKTLLPFMGDEPSRRINRAMRQASEVVGVNLRREVLPLLSGEIGVMLSPPEGAFNPDQRPLDLVKLSPVLFLGLNDVSKFEQTLSEIADSLRNAGLAHADVLETRSMGGQEIYRLFLTSDALLPGIALTPTATLFRERDGSGLVALSNHPEKIHHLLEMMRDTPVDGRIAAYVSTGDVLTFIAQQQGEMPKSLLEQLGKLRPVVAVIDTTPNSISFSLISPEARWLDQIVNGVVAGILADRFNKETGE